MTRRLRFPGGFTCLPVLLAAALVAACGLPFRMPDADVDLRGYEVCDDFSEGLAMIKVAEEWTFGYMDAGGEIVIPPRFESAGPFSEGLAAVDFDHRRGWGYIDAEGRTVIEPRFDAAMPFSEGLAAVRIGDSWGYVGRSGELLIEHRFDDAFDFSQGRARVVVDGLVGFIDREGGWVLAAAFWRAGDFSEGKAWVCDRSHCGFVGLDGEILIERSFDDAGSFSLGLAPVREGGAWGYVGSGGQWVIEPTFAEAHPFSDGLALVGLVKDSSSSSKFGGYTGRKVFYGFIDPEGQTVIPIEIQGATPFADGISTVRVPSGGFCSDCYSYRLMTTDGSLLDGVFESAWPFREGLAVVQADDLRGERRSYVVDRKAAPLIALDRSYRDDGELRTRVSRNLRYGYIDTEGQTVIPFQFTEAQPFADGVAFVEGNRERPYRDPRFVDSSGALAVELPEGISRALPFSEGLALVADNRLAWGYMNRAGELIVEPSFENATSFSEGLASVKTTDAAGANDWGYIDTEGRPVIVPRFHAAGPFRDGLAFVEWISEESSLLSGLIDPGGRVVVELDWMHELSQLLSSFPSHDRMRKLRQQSFAEGLFPKHGAGGLGYVDATGGSVLRNPDFRAVRAFSEGLAAVMLGVGPARHGAWGYIDTAGELVIEPRFAEADRFSEGLARVRDGAGRLGYVDRSGRLAIPPAWFEDAHAFSGGRAIVKLNGRWGVIGRDGELVVPPRYLRAEPHSEGLAAVAVETSTLR